MKTENETEDRLRFGGDAWLSELRCRLECIQGRYNSTIDSKTGLPPVASLDPFLWQSKAAAMADDARLLLQWLPLETKESAAGAHWLGRLVRCCRALGMRSGWRYWRLQNKAIRDPGLMPVVCAAIEAGAHRLRAEGNEIEAALMEDFAAEARRANRRRYELPQKRS